MHTLTCFGHSLTDLWTAVVDGLGRVAARLKRPTSLDREPASDLHCTDHRELIPARPAFGLVLAPACQFLDWTVRGSPWAGHIHISTSVRFRAVRIAFGPFADVLGSIRESSSWPRETALIPRSCFG